MSMEKTLLTIPQIQDVQMAPVREEQGLIHRINRYLTLCPDAFRFTRGAAEIPFSNTWPMKAVDLA